jgi:hypothetical protein
MRAVNIHLRMNSVIHDQRRQQLKAMICKGRRHTVRSAWLMSTVCCIEGDETRRPFKRLPDGDIATKIAWRFEAACLILVQFELLGT